jgi:hypothetical protein
MQRELLACESSSSNCLAGLHFDKRRQTPLLASRLTPSFLFFYVPADGAYGQSTGGYNAYGSRRLSSIGEQTRGGDRMGTACLIVALPASAAARLLWLAGCHPHPFLLSPVPPVMSAGTMQRGLLACEWRGSGLPLHLSLSKSATAAPAPPPWLHPA